LSGSRRIEIQDKLRDMNFIDQILNPLFDLLFHPTIDPLNSENSLINDEFDSNNPLATTRIQLLRIIINFCDRDSQNTANKELLISPQEKDILYSNLLPKALISHCHQTCCEKNKVLSTMINDMEIEPLDKENSFFAKSTLKENAFESVEKKGLLNKIISLFSRFHPNSNYRFWLASCVESFLRGFSEAHQIFVAHSGLLYGLLHQIIHKQVSKSSNVQISYDLIGEIVKFNKYNMIFLEHICEKFGWTHTLANHTSLNIIDSNVFLRSLLLSSERFNFLEAGRESNFSQDSTVLGQFFKEKKNWFNTIVESIEPDLMSQDNICCVNTTIILAIFADQKGELEGYISDMVGRKAKNSQSAIKLLQNLSSILMIWSRYYKAKTKDGFSLQFTTSIPFSYFKNMREKLQILLDQKIQILEGQ